MSRLLPGYVNAHTHLYSGLVEVGVPMPEPRPRGLPETLTRFWWRLDRALDEASLRASARRYALQALEHGTTTLVDHHESPSFIEGSLDVIADECQALGVRALVCYGATCRNGGDDEGMRGLAECRRFIESNHRPLVKGAIGLHASFTVSDKVIREAGLLARELGAVVHVHVAEDRCDVDDAIARGHRSPLERLLSLGALPPGSIVAHAVHLDEQEVQLASAMGLWLVHNPRSNEGNAVGYAASLADAPLVALGTDGYPSDMRVEMEAAVRVARAAGRRPPPLSTLLSTGPRLSRALFGDVTERDMIVADARAAEQVLVDGVVRARGGRHVSVSREEVEEIARGEAARLCRAMETLP